MTQQTQRTFARAINLLQTCRLCCGPTCYGETGVMDFGLIKKVFSVQPTQKTYGQFYELRPRSNNRYITAGNLSSSRLTNQYRLLHMLT